MSFRKLFISAAVLVLNCYSFSLAGKTVLLTIDDGPHEYYTEKIMDILEEEGVTATFFLVGKMIEKNQDLTLDIYRRGFEIGNHTYNHIRMDSMSREEIESELESVNLLLQDLTGKRSRFFRPPGGRINSRVQEKAAELGYSSVLWTRNSMDAAPGISRDRIYHHSTRNPGKQEIILLHSGIEETLKALRPIIRFYKEKGYSFKNLSGIHIPLIRRGMEIYMGDRFHWVYFLGGERAEKYPPFKRGGNSAASAVALAAAGSLLFLAKKRGGLLRKKEISLVFLGAEKEALIKISRLLKEEELKTIFFVAAADEKKISSSLGEHLIAPLSLKSDAGEELLFWKEQFKGKGYFTMPLCCRIKPFSSREAREVRDRGFVPLEFKNRPGKTPFRSRKELYDYMKKNIRKGGVIPLRGDCSLTARMLGELIEKIKEKKYNLKGFNEYLYEKYTV